MNPLETFGYDAARLIGLQTAEFPPSARPQFLFEVLENVAPGLYARTVLSANAANQRGVPMGEAVFTALSNGVVEAIAKQAISNGTPPIALDGFFSKVGNVLGKIVAAPVKLVGHITSPLVSEVAKLISGTLTKATCPIVSTPQGQVAIVGAAAYYSGGAAAGAAGAGAQGMAAACGKGGAAAPPGASIPQSSGQKASGMQKYILPAAVAGGAGLLLWVVLKR